MLTDTPSSTTNTRTSLPLEMPLPAKPLEHTSALSGRTLSSSTMSSNSFTEENVTQCMTATHTCHSTWERDMELTSHIYTTLNQALRTT